ncbi:MAG: radical SAM family heme chaperone HemW [Rickettsiales bacterium]
MSALYIHWPFCKKKCPYCDFNSHVREGVDHARWRAALVRELEYWHARVPDFQLNSLFFGGGTPSLMAPETAAALIARAQQLWSHDEAMEITLEANPTSVEAEKFVQLRAAEVNRLSLGIQSLRPEALAFLGREHSADEARAAIALAQKIFPRYTFDLIYALPGQTLEGWEQELRAALKLARDHLSLYQLTIEENTAFHHAYHVDKAFTLPSEELAAEFYALTQRVMEEAGLPAYEISNHARAGHESQHNLCYWRSEAYLGIGPGAHGRVDVPASGLLGPPQRLATRNLKSPERWLEQVERMGHGLEEETPLSVAERAEETVLMGLRLHEGIALGRLRADERAYLENLWRDGRLQRLQDEGLLEATNDCLRATPRGSLLLNALIEQVLR